MTKCDCDTDSDNSGVTEVNATHFTHCFHKIKKEWRRLVAPSGVVLSLQTPPPLRFIFNQSGCETLPRLLFKRHTSSGGNFQSQGRHSISGVVITEDRVCSPSLFVAGTGWGFSTTSWKSHHYSGSHLFQLFQSRPNSRKLNSSANEHWFFFFPPIPNFLLYFLI